MIWQPASRIYTKYTVIAQEAGPARRFLLAAGLLLERFAADADLPQIHSIRGKHFTQSWERRFDGSANLSARRNEVCVGAVLVDVQGDLDRTQLWGVYGKLRELLFVAGEPQQLLAKLTGPCRVTQGRLQIARDVLTACCAIRDTGQGSGDHIGIVCRRQRFRFARSGLFGSGQRDVGNGKICRFDGS